MNATLERLPVLVLEPHSRCNCRCVMCDIWKSTAAEQITAAELKRHLEDIERLGVEWAVFSGGEPLMHSDLFRLAGLLRARGIRISILSTGLLLERHAAQIVTHIDDVIVSLDGPQPVHDQVRGTSGAFEHLAAGVRALHALDPEYPVSARCTVQALNAAHLRATVAAARALRLRSISFLAADLTSTAFNRLTVWPRERQQSIRPDLAVLEPEIEALIQDDSAGGFIAESPEKLRRIAAYFRALAGREPHHAPRCNAPWVSAVVEANGDVRPCFFQPSIGNLRDGTLAAVINGPRAVAFRERLDVATNEICRRCVCSLFRAA